MNERASMRYHGSRAMRTLACLLAWSISDSSKLKIGYTFGNQCDTLISLCGIWVRQHCTELMDIFDVNNLLKPTWQNQCMHNFNGLSIDQCCTVRGNSLIFFICIKDFFDEILSNIEFIIAIDVNEIYRKDVHPPYGCRNQFLRCAFFLFHKRIVLLCTRNLLSSIVMHAQVKKLS